MKKSIELNKTQMLPYTFTSKAETLKFLKKFVKKSRIEKVFDFTVNEWDKNHENILKKLQKAFKSKIIVRSSAAGEDSHEKSEAGSYDSVLNVNPQSKESVQNAVNQVIRSYELRGNKNTQNYVLIQRQTKDIVTSGVVLTRESKHGSPYIIINFEDSSQTDGVTKGKSNETIKIFRNTSYSSLPKKWRSLIAAIKEIESIISMDYLDIEFGITKKSEVVIFQVRPITSIQQILKSTNDRYVEKTIESCKNKFKKLQKSKKLFGKKTIFSDMSDWNPAEIIGNDPNLLDYSLYDYLIMNRSWGTGRSNIGYKKSADKLMVKFGNKPYVDIRASFNSLIPANLEKNIQKKLINFYLDKLEKNPHLHDKVEFEILFSCYDFSLNNRLKELEQYGFTKNQIKKIKENLIEFTNLIIEKYPTITEKSKYSLNKMSENREKILADVKKKENHIDLLNSAYNLLDDCKNFGVIPFSTMARIAFIASIMLKSLAKEGLIEPIIVESIMNSINTPLSRFRKDFEKFSDKKISRSVFLKEYGHLRPGTYDITARRYDDANQFLRDIKFTKTKSKKQKTTINLNINKIFKKHGLNLDRERFKKFIEDSLREREELKFEFTKNLSEALELIAKAGEKLGFSRDDMKDLDIMTIQQTYNKLDLQNLKFEWKKRIKHQRKNKLYNENLLLPPLIFSEKDFEVISHYIVKPNFITRNSVTSELVYLENLDSIPNLEHKIILIENADPGYDWIFTKNPAGLVTRYGGVASHMSIRCAEMSLPAAIGCGETLFEQLVLSSKIILDCKNNQIVILEHKIDDEYIEERKALKSLGYIK